MSHSCAGNAADFIDREVDNKGCVFNNRQASITAQQIVNMVSTTPDSYVDKTGKPTICSWKVGGLRNWYCHILAQMCFVVQEHILVVTNVILCTASGQLSTCT